MYRFFYIYLTLQYLATQVQGRILKLIIYHLWKMAGNSYFSAEFFSLCVFCLLFFINSKTDRLAKGSECYQKSLSLNPFLWSPFESLCEIGRYCSILQFFFIISVLIILIRNGTQRMSYLLLWTGKNANVYKYFTFRFALLETKIEQKCELLFWMVSFFMKTHSVVFINMIHAGLYRSWF